MVRKFGGNCLCLCLGIKSGQNLCLYSKEYYALPPQTIRWGGSMVFVIDDGVRQYAQAGSVRSSSPCRFRGACRYSSGSGFQNTGSQLARGRWFAEVQVARFARGSSRLARRKHGTVVAAGDAVGLFSSRKLDTDSACRTDRSCGHVAAKWASKAVRSGQRRAASP